MTTGRQLPASYLFAALACLAGRDACGQQGMAAPLPASAIMARGGGDGWQSSGGVVGPWWSGSATGAQPPAADGGFWFGVPGFGFGGSQGSSRNLGGVGSTLTATPGLGGMVSSGRLTPFVTGVIPVVGSGYPTPPSLPFASQPAFPAPRLTGSPQPGVSRTLPTPPTQAPIRPSTPASRARAERFVAAGDRHLLEAVDGPAAARAALDDYRAAGRFAQDDCDVQIRQAILHVALGQPEAADRAIQRATQIDGRLALQLDSAPGEGLGPDGGPLPPVVAARGEAILEAIASAGGERPAAARAAFDWLEAAWKSHWSAAASTPPGGTP